MTAFTLLMALVATVCAVWAVIVYRQQSLRWRELEDVMGGEANVLALVVALQAMRDEDTDSKIRKGMLALKDMGEIE